jgi:FkbM family methyltransferase
VSRIRGRRRVARLLVRYPTSLTYRDTLGFARHTDLADTIDAYWFLGVNCGLPRTVIERLPAGTTAVDAGANIGVVAGQLCRAVGPHGTVHAIEPLPANVRRLRELKRDNALDQLIIWECALSDESGSAILRTERTAGTSGHASFTASWIAHAKVPVVTRVLDEVVLDSTRLDFMKLDVEGAESAVLDGATRILTNDRPLVFCEFNDIILRDAGSSAEALLRKFASLGYAPAPEYVRHAMHLSNAVTDVLLVPE